MEITIPIPYNLLNVGLLCENENENGKRKRTQRDVIDINNGITQQWITSYDVVVWLILS